MGYMMPVEREFVTPEFVRLYSARLRGDDQSGITTFTDMYYFEDEVAAATAEAGMRALCGQTVMRFGTHARCYEEGLARAASSSRLEGPSVDRSDPGTARTPIRALRKSCVLRGARRRVRRPISHPSRRNAARSETNANAAWNAGRSLCAETRLTRCKTDSGTLRPCGCWRDTFAPARGSGCFSQPFLQSQACVRLCAGHEDA